MSTAKAFDWAALSAPKPPWIVNATTQMTGLPAAEEGLAESGITVRVLRGSKMRTKSQLLSEFASRLAFPEYFGANWDALADCLGDLDWLRGFAYVIMIEEAEELLAEEPPDQLRLFSELIERVGARWAERISLGEDWDRPAIPFHVVLVYSSPRS